MWVVRVLGTKMMRFMRLCAGVIDGWDGLCDIAGPQ